MESEPNAQEADRFDDTVQQRAIPLLSVILARLNALPVARYTLQLPRIRFREQEFGDKTPASSRCGSWSFSLQPAYSSQDLAILASSCSHPV